MGNENFYKGSYRDEFETNEAKRKALAMLNGESYQTMQIKTFEFEEDIDPKDADYYKQKAKERSGLVFYRDWLDDILLLEPQEVYKVLFVIKEFLDTGKTPEIPDDRAVRMFLRRVLSRMAEDEQKYKEKCQKNRENALKRSRKKQEE